MTVTKTSARPDAALIARRLEELAAFSEEGTGVTRLYLTEEHRQAADLVLAWMREAGMTARLDPVGNVVGRYEGVEPGRPCLMFGSHIDSVRSGGKYDGPLGIVAPIECVAALTRVGRRLPFAIEVVAFGDEEGARFQSVLMGSRAIAGTFDEAALAARDVDGVSVEEAMKNFGLEPATIPQAARRREEVHAYVEFHIEQGPVLEAEGLPVGIVTAINGQTRLRVVLTGQPGHAGTVPMRLRHDPLLAAAEIMLELEEIANRGPEVVGTVGRLAVGPGAANVIPGRVEFSVDIRAPEDEARRLAVAETRSALARIAARRGVEAECDLLLDVDAAACAPWLMEQLDRAVAGEGFAPRRLPSGAGHDGMAMVALTDIAMLFLRCEGGISHNPAEAVSEADTEAGTRVLMRFIEEFEAR